MVVYGGRPETTRTPVDVVARFSATGTITPIRVIWPDGRRYDLQVTHREQRYDRDGKLPYIEFDVEVVISGKTRHMTKLWFDYRRWYVEAKGR